MRLIRITLGTIFLMIAALPFLIATVLMPADHRKKITLKCLEQLANEATKTPQ